MDIADSKGDDRDRPSKSQRKREAEAVLALAKRLVALSQASLARVVLDDTLREAVVAAERLDRAALKRQLKYLAGLLREVDTGEIARQLDRIDQPHRRAVQAFHEVEQWRDALVAGDDTLINVLIERLPGVDPQRLQQLIYAARKEQALRSAPRSSRRLFRYLAELYEGA